MPTTTPMQLQTKTTQQNYTATTQNQNNTRKLHIQYYCEIPDEKKNK